MPATIYILCTVTALICCLLLFRGYRQNRARLLFWSGLCFLALTLQNFALFLDIVVFPAVDLRPLRIIFALLAISFLLYGLIWKEK